MTAIRSIKTISVLRAQSGLCWGNIALNDIEFPPGTYTLRAYTNWMLKLGAMKAFFIGGFISAARAKTIGWLIRGFSKSTSSTGQKNGKRPGAVQAIQTKYPLLQNQLNLQVMNGDRRLYRQKRCRTDNDSGAMDVNFNIPREE